MNTVQHTPGPWHVIDSEPTRAIFNGCVVIAAEGIDDAIIASMGDDVRDAEANARLIAAAPEMLEALEAFLVGAYLDNGTLCGWCGYRTEVGGGHLHNDICRVGKAEAAIRKAKGESA